ncbi:hypothetical protein CALCODRAFT_185147 [Calocera cornea HHB12733]|uniref:Uncharacterized protein n=1 Tax=Calocera cornea HHB12733 TaxID=1353952 RepID=A0A165HNI2_9BASI|nr:hypothetical protein CALCODRAFT_185147 [Calocera cornea HHB12733]
MALAEAVLGAVAVAVAREHGRRDAEERRAVAPRCCGRCAVRGARGRPGGRGAELERPWGPARWETGRWGDARLRLRLRLRLGGRGGDMEREGA